MRNAVLAILAVCLSVSLTAQNTQTFAIDPYWRKPLPDKWIIGRTGSICADAHDHLVVTNRRDITAEEAETSIQSPSVLIFDLAGNLVHSFGDSNTVPGVVHGCFVDHENNIWLTGNGDGTSRSGPTTESWSCRSASAECSIRPTARQRGSCSTRAARNSSTLRASSSIPRTATCTSRTDTATGAWRCSTEPAPSCVSGVSRQRRRKSRQARVAHSRRLCTASQ